MDADGQPISVEPKYLLVPTTLKHLVIELTQGATLIMSGTDNAVRPALNVLSDENLQVISSPYLGNSAYEGSSQTGWYLFGDPKTVDTWEIGFLKGKRTPTGALLKSNGYPVTSHDSDLLRKLVPRETAVKDFRDPVDQVLSVAFAS
ncbi:MAG: hypothetical protein L6W00_10230 [Lentisphaeria bacterium]|nr:MAG: hypothetical protein L6W00_10230 [Lentisphaeria bacterium]